MYNIILFNKLAVKILAAFFMIYKGLFFGLTTIDIQYFVDSFPLSNKKVKTNAPEFLVGGPATNAAVAFSFLNNGTFLVSSVGENSFTPFIREDFLKNNIQFIDLGNRESMPVVASVVTSSNGDRNIFTHHPELTDNNFDVNEVLNLVQPEIILLDGFYPEAAVLLAKEAFRKKIPIVLDCGSWKPQYDELLKYAEVAICSADFLPPHCETCNDVFSFLKSKGVRDIAITRGNKSILFETIESKGEVEVTTTTVVDTLGAGDFIHGAFCFYRLKYNSFEQALTKASELATFTCTFKGTRQWLNMKSMMSFI